MHPNTPLTLGQLQTIADQTRERKLRELMSDLSDRVQAGDMTDMQANEWYNMKADQWAGELT